MDPPVWACLRKKIAKLQERTTGRQQQQHIQNAPPNNPKYGECALPQPPRGLHTIAAGVAAVVAGIGARDTSTHSHCGVLSGGSLYLRSSHSPAVSFRVFFFDFSFRVNSCGQGVLWSRFPEDNQPPCTSQPSDYNAYLRCAYNTPNTTSFESVCHTSDESGGVGG